MTSKCYLITGCSLNVMHVGMTFRLGTTFQASGGVKCGRVGGGKYNHKETAE